MPQPPPMAPSSYNKQQHLHQQLQHNQQHQLLQQQQHQQHDPTRYEHRQLPSSQMQQPPTVRPDVVDLPKMEMNMSLVSSAIGPMPAESPLVLPPHPPSRSASSDPNDDVTFSRCRIQHNLFLSITDDMSI
jgi:hypothetical protein